MVPHISKERCKDCGDCVSLCPYDVFSVEGGRVRVTRPEDCIECNSCVDQCPEQAIFLDD